MKTSLPHLALIVLLLLWLAMAAPWISERYTMLGQTSDLLRNRSLDERSALLDNPAFPVARQIEQVVPPQACVAVLAYSGAAAVDYYRARLAYLLYPRRVHVFADSSAAAENCGFLAVFRDTRQNLAAEPFQGRWNDEELSRRLEGLQQVAADQRVHIYRVP